MKVGFCRASFGGKKCRTLRNRPIKTRGCPHDKGRLVCPKRQIVISISANRKAGTTTVVMV